MSLISTKNLIAPLTNKLHMIALLLLTVGFVALRLSGAAVKLERSADSRAEREVTDDLIDLPVRRADRAPAASPALKPAHPARDFSSMAKEVRPPWEGRRSATPPPAAEPPARKKGGLEDIEKALGMK